MDNRKIMMGSAALLLFVLAACLPTIAAKSAEQKAPTAKELLGGPWVNTSKGEAHTIASRLGKVTVVHFWTFGCINCKRNLPIYAKWQKQFAKQDVEIIGIHTPETEEEKVADNVLKRVKEMGITYPVLLDQKRENWNRWEQEYWPTVYVIDRKGRVRYRWTGELEYKSAGGTAIVEEQITKLLLEK